MSDLFKPRVICPKCNAVRPEDTTAPDWQCPSCGIAYIKAGDAQPSRAAANLIYSSAQQEERRGATKYLVLAVLGCAIGGWRKYNNAKTEEAIAAVSASARVVMFATSWCPYCAAAHSFFVKNKIQFVEYDIERDPEGGRMYDKLGFKGTGVPVILVDGKVQRGFNEAALTQALL